MNKWIADVFGSILTLGHLLTIVGIIFVLNEGTAGILEVFLFFIIYVLVVGTLTVFIPINEKLGDIIDILKRALPDNS